MKNRDLQIKKLYRLYLIECLFQDIDTKIDNPPESYFIFKKRLYNKRKSAIIKP